MAASRPAAWERCKLRAPRVQRCHALVSLPSIACGVAVTGVAAVLLQRAAAEAIPRRCTTCFGAGYYPCATCKGRGKVSG